MIRLARLSIRFPKAALTFWVAVAAALALVGFGVSDQLSPSKTVVAGTESSRAEHLARAEFGTSVLIPILLQGPKADLDHQGPALVRALQKRTDLRTLSAWDAGPTGREYRPSPTAAMIIVSAARTEEEMVRDVQPQIERTVDRIVSGPVTAHLTGAPVIDRALKDASIDATRTAELIALPILFFLMLLILRRPVAALVVTAFGATTIFAGFGAMALTAKVIDTDPIAVALGSLAGVALGVGYATVVVRRFAHELEEGGHPHTREETAEHVRHVVSTTSRGVLVGGTAFLTSLVVATLIAPTEILTSVGVGVVVCSAVGVGAAVAVMPAVLTLFGRVVDLGGFRAPRIVRSGWNHLLAGERFVTGRAAAFVGFAATVAIAVLAMPAIDLGTGPPDISQLPKSSKARQDYEAIAKTMGPGFATPYNIVISSKRTPITDPALLSQVQNLQETVAKDARVASVVGPGAIKAQTKDLKKLPATLKDSKKLLTSGKKDLGKLQNGLGQAGDGARQLRAGLNKAAAGAGQLQSGSGSAQSGAAQLHAGLAAARSGAYKISAGLGTALNGAQALRQGAAQALAGSKQISGGLGTAVKPVKAGVPVVNQLAQDVKASSGAVSAVRGSAQAAVGNLDEALAALQAMDAGKSDPRYASAVAALQAARSQAGTVDQSLGAVDSKLSGASGIAGAFAGQVAELSKGLQQLYDGSSALQTGIGKLAAGNADLATGIGKLNTGGGQLTVGLGKLTSGAGQLEAGLGQLTSGAGQLATALQGGSAPTGKLANGLDTMQAGVAKFSKQLPSVKDLEELEKASPGLFQSGYFVLAALAGAPPNDRRVASFAVNLSQGGNTGQIVVTPKHAASSDATQALGERLRKLTDQFATKNHVEAAVGGPAGDFSDYRSETQARMARVVAGVALAVTLLMMLLLRSVAIPMAATVSSLMAAAAAFGVMATLFTGDDPLLGGPGYIDPMSITGVFAAIFGLSMIISVILVDRTREELLVHGDLHRAVDTALVRTATASTAIGAVMVAAAIPFAAQDLINLRQFGVGMAAVALINVLLIRPVLLPAAITVLGRRAWWPTKLPAPPAPPQSDGAIRPPATRFGHQPA